MAGKDADVTNTANGGRRTDLDKTPLTVEQVGLPMTSPKKRRAKAWLADYQAVWRKELGGVIPYGQGAQALKSLEKTYGKKQVLNNLENYCKAHKTSHEGMYASISRFSQTFSAYNENAAPPSERNADSAKEAARVEATKRVIAKYGKLADRSPRQRLKNSTESVELSDDSIELLW